MATVPRENVEITIPTSDVVMLSEIEAVPNRWIWGDPGHTRVINAGSLHFLSQKNYDAEIGRTAMTDYRWCYKADFMLNHIDYTQYNMVFGLTAMKPAFVPKKR